MKIKDARRYLERENILKSRIGEDNNIEKIQILTWAYSTYHLAHLAYGEPCYLQN